MIPAIKFTQYKTTFWHEKKDLFALVFIVLFFILIIWFSIFVLMNYSYVQMCPFGWFNFRLGFTYHLSREMNFFFQNDHKEIIPTISFISRYFTEAVIRDWQDTKLKWNLMERLLNSSCFKLHLCSLNGWN